MGAPVVSDASLSRLARRLRQPLTAVFAGRTSAEMPEHRTWRFCDGAGGEGPSRPPSCGVCRRTILAGERTRAFVVDARRIEVCPLWAVRLARSGFGRAA